MIVLDIEASGTEPDVHSIVSIGAIDLKEPKRQFYAECCIWNGSHIMDGALEVNGFTEAEITDLTKPTEGEIVAQFLDWMLVAEDQTLVGQNVSFDRDFVRAAANRAHLACQLAFRTIDTHTLCFMHMVNAGITPPFDVEHKHSAINLDIILQYCGIPKEPRPHNALTGALCHAEVASRLLYSKKLLPEFSAYEVPWSPK